MMPKALIYLEVEALDGLNGLKRKIIELRKVLRISQSSSVYKRSKRKELGKQYLAIVVCTEGLSKSEEYLKVASTAGGELLAVEGELRLDPEFTLPSPTLQLDGFVLHLAAECAPHWEHRVRQKSLSELSHETKLDEPAEFLTQGQTLISL